jgi:threonyl-tRNA synthetase
VRFAVADPTINVTLPDGSVRVIQKGTRIVDFALSIGAGLGKACLGAKLDGSHDIVDLRMPLVRDCKIEIVTDKSPDGLRVIRHSASHVMADAITKLWPRSEADDRSRRPTTASTTTSIWTSVSPREDLPKIEAAMAKRRRRRITAFERCAVDRQ